MAVGSQHDRLILDAEGSRLYCESLADLDGQFVILIDFLACVPEPLVDLVDRKAYFIGKYVDLVARGCLTVHVPVKLPK